MNDDFDRLLDDALSAPSPAAPAHFTERVMARVAVTAQDRPARVPALDAFPLAPTLPWWVRAAFEPASVLATVVVAVLLWRGAALSGLIAVATSQLTEWVASVPQIVASVWLQPTTLAGTAFAAVPLVFLMSQLLYRWSADLVGPRSLAIRTR